ncbi:lysophospholipid hydrolase, partial [Tremellales sp. Uapishka_1]
MSNVPPPPVADGNPLVALAAAVIYAILYVLQGVRYTVGLMTISFPSFVVRMLQYSFTISLGFPSLLALFFGGALAAFVLVRYRYLTRYTQLKEEALPHPSPPSLTADLLPLDNIALTDSRSRSNPFHNYLDDFLAAVRIFGFLEKPVFHELSRHLQTRRLAAGDTLDIGSGDFWCVVEGKVQVFAPSSSENPSLPPSPDPFPSQSTSFNGYHLLNEVSTGGTLSSLFSILTLFTEDVKLSWSSGHDAEEEDVDPDATMLADPPARSKSRANSDVSQLDFITLGTKTDSPDGIDRKLKRSSSVGASEDEVKAESPASPPDRSATSASLPGTTAGSPISEPVRGPMPQRTGTSHTYRPRPTAKSKRRDSGLGSKALKGTIARATVDTTLAVIPAEAFRKLTRKFPKASGTIVQVVLERFSRVTFMTAHKYLGLTREILRSEATLNTLVNHALPRSFYTGGGMQALRERFQPEVHLPRNKSSPTLDRSDPRVTSKDYFNFVPTSPTVRAPSLPSLTPKSDRSPSVGASFANRLGSMTKIDRNPVIGPPASAPLSPDTAVRHSSTFVRRTSAMRKQVAAGDLAMTNSGMRDDGGAYYRSGGQTPGLSRMDTWRGRFPQPSDHPLNENGIKADGLVVDTETEEDAFELREAVLLSIAKSIGLVQPDSAIGDVNRSIPASVSAASQPNSPMFPPNSRSSKSAFGNVLDMINASSPSDNLIGGMLREGLLGNHMEDEASSISASVQDSQAGTGGPPNVLKDLESNVDILFFKKGSVLVKEGEKSAGIYYVIDGFLETPPSSAPRPTTFSNMNGRTFGAALGLDPPVDPGAGNNSGEGDGRFEEHLFNVKPGGVAGYLAALCSTDSYVNVTAKTDCFVGFLPKHTLERIIERRPIVLLTLAKRLLSLLSPLVLHIDAALDWQQLGAGQVLYDHGDRSSDFYVVINGRLRSLLEKDKGVEVLREYGQNDSIGELDVITAVNRSDTVHAIRDSELVRIPGALFDAISIRHPETTIQFLRLIAKRVKKAVGEQTLAGRSGPSQGPAIDVNLKTVCILGSTRNVPVAQFAGKLKTSLEEVGASTSYLDQGTVMRHLGRHAFARIGKLKVAGWLADQEQHYRSVLYVADTPASSQWTLTCIRQADLILVVAMGDDPSLGEYEKLLLATKTTARKELVLLHDERTVAPGSTRQWLKNRPWLHAHHHVELPGVVSPSKSNPPVHDPAAIAAFKHLRGQVETRIKKYRGLRPLGRARRPPHMNDFARIARRLCGKSIGLVLGGGGARGISHIGMLQALEEFGIPIDVIGGCSIGSFVGGLYAKETDLLVTTGRTKQFAGRMGSMWRILSDVTYPFVAYTTGHEFSESPLSSAGVITDGAIVDRGIYKAFYNTHIEDFWTPFFANSTNITHSRMEIHRTGYAWRYVRASMTLAGLLPPLSDDGNLLVDGGYMDNTPVAPLKAMGIRDIIVVDVGSVDDTSPRNYGDSVSGWWIFLNRFNPFYERKVLSMTEISSRLTYVSSVLTLGGVKNAPGILYMAMPVQQFDTLGGFKHFTELVKIGLQAGRDSLQKWKDEGTLPSGLVDDVKGVKTIKRGNRLRWVTRVTAAWTVLIKTDT